MVLVKVGGQRYYLNEYLKGKWDNIKGGRLVEKDEDRVYIVSGRERSGKSVFTLQQACYIDPTLVKDMSRICFTAEDFLKAIKTAKPGRCVIFDEAFRGLSSRSAMSKVNKKIIQAMMEMGQKNLIVFIVLPAFWLLDTYPAILRSEALFLIEKNKQGKRLWKMYNYKKKAKIYELGLKKGWEYKSFTLRKDYFFNHYPGGEDFETKYRRMKSESLQEMEEITKTELRDRAYAEKTQKLILILQKEKGLSDRKVSLLLKRYGIPYNFSNLSQARGQYPELLNV